MISKSPRILMRTPISVFSKMFRLLIFLSFLFLSCYGESEGGWFNFLGSAKKIPEDQPVVAKETPQLLIDGGFENYYILMLRDNIRYAFITCLDV
jgi:hypothetical protein